jgi:hypothetical protein
MRSEPTASWPRPIWAIPSLTKLRWRVERPTSTQRSRCRSPSFPILTGRIAQIDGPAEKATSKGRTGSTVRLASDQRRNRGKLAMQRTEAARALATLPVEKAGIAGQRAIAEADLGPVKYFATLIGVSDEVVMPWFILLVACLPDPAAVVLLYAAARAR